MASNKFATMLHRNTNKTVAILVYAVLEWLLILLLLLNSSFSYLIARFADLVGLQQPCLFCSRLDHVFQKSAKNLDKDLVCDSHAEEISKLGFCSNHRKLAESQNMCEDCLASRPSHHEQHSSFGMMHRNIGFISWMSHEKSEEIVVEKIKKCSCCNESLKNQLYPPYLLLKPSWGDDSLVVESIDDEKEGGDKGLDFERNIGEEDHDIESFILREVAEDRSSSVSNLHSDEKDVEKDEKEDDGLNNIKETDPSGFICRFTDDSAMNIVSFFEDRSIEVIDVHFENDAACNDARRLIPVEFIDSVTSMHFESCKINEDLVEMEQEIENFAVKAESSVLEGFMDNNEAKTSIEELQSWENSIVLETEEFKKDSVFETLMNDDDKSVEAASEEQDNIQGYAVDLLLSEEPICSNESTKEDESSTDDESSESDDDTDVQNAFDEFLAQNNLSKSQSLSNVDDNSIEADMEEQDNSPIDNLPSSEEPTCSSQCIAEDQSSESEDDDTGASNAFDEFISQNNLCQDKAGTNDDVYAETTEKTISAEKNHEETSHQLSKFSESYEAEEEKLPETPNSSDGLHYMHRKLMLFDKRESGGAEDSVDGGSVASELEYGCDPASSIDRLKTALKSERKALSSIYQELEEERSASAVAANQTMAMITRLQEEKAAMQMEALQYQRMMEEQAEYDQEALQLLNELMLKREKEKRELEIELEECRQKIMEYEAREKLKALRRMKDGNDRSIDLNREDNDNDNANANANAETVTDLEDMALDCVNHISELDDSLAEFEEERASILDQLRALEEKIINLEDNDELIDENCDYSSPEDNVHSQNEFPDENKQSPRRTIGSLAKTLLPYLDAAENDTEEAYEFDTSSQTIMEPESVVVDGNVKLRDSEADSEAAKVSIEEEVDRVYERLQALETDREFLQHCMGSIQSGDKGVDLLQEILQHLRDLKAVELRLKNLDSDPLDSSEVSIHQPL